MARLGLVLGVAPGIPPVDAETPPTDPLAEVNREAITAKDLEQALGARLAALEEEIYSLKRQGVDCSPRRRPGEESRWRHYWTRR